MSYKIVLTTDRTLTSNYRNNQGYGISSTLPRRVLPYWIHYSFLCPSGAVDSRGALLKASLGLRKVEAAVINSGLIPEREIITVHPYYLHQVINSETEVVLITTFDPLGIGPVTSTFSNMIGGEAFIPYEFKKLLKHPALKKYHPKIIVGGPGAWQFAKAKEASQNFSLKKMGLDCVVEGEGEITAPELVERALKGDPLPEFVHGKVVENSEDIPDIKNPTVVGLVEVTRGCRRGCQFCNPAAHRFRSRSLDRVLSEVEINLRGDTKRITFHAEDIFQYQAHGLQVNVRAVIELFDTVNRLDRVKSVTGTHAALSSAVSTPEVVKGFSEVLGLGRGNRPVKFLQVGIETGSPPLIKRLLRGKTYPFQPEEWPEVVREGFELFLKNHIIPISSIILGLPGETEEDIRHTIKLVRSLRKFPSLITPFYFVSMGQTRLEGERSLDNRGMTPSNYELMALAWEHNFFWAPTLYPLFDRWAGPFQKYFITNLLRSGGRYLSYRIRRLARRHGAHI